MAFIQTQDKIDLYVKDWGKGSLVVLIHGWPLSADSWDAVAVELVEAGHRVVSYDRRGFGRSDQPFTGYDYDTLADDLAAVINYALPTQPIGEKATLVGFSMGGGEVARYMFRYGGKGVGKTVLIASILPFLLRTQDNPTGIEQREFDQIETALRSDRAHFFKGFFEKFFGVSILAPSVSTESLMWMQAIAMQAGMKPTLACLSAFSGTDFRPDLAAFTVPTLIIHGTDDAIVPIEVSAHLVKEKLPQAILREYPGAPHGLFGTDRHRLMQDLLLFLHDD
jgi:pimeloyl-ACP methyl ester carboxylesterase